MPDRVDVPQGSETIPRPGSSDKGKGKGKNRTKASEQAMTKTKFAGAHTRLQAKLEREAKEKVKSGMDKLLSSSKKLTDDSDIADLSEPDQPLVGDFSSHDLIRNRIADPPVFDEPIPPDPTADSIVIVSHKNVPRTEVGNVNSRWSFSINPMNYFRSETPYDGATPSNEVKEENQEIEQIGLISPPQQASTPND